MATGTRICKICGKEYEYCKTNRVVEGVFRWQDVACCVEHGQEYLDLIMISRGLKQAQESEAIVSTKESEVVTRKPRASRKRQQVEE